MDSTLKSNLSVGLPLDLLVYLSHQLSGARVLIVGNYRDVEVDRAHPLSGALADLRRESTFRRVPSGV